jgi:predicted GNAT superfamily acetyltransferase
MSHFSDYIMEKTDDLILEDDSGFVRYRFFDDGETVYITDIFVPKHLRGGRVATHLADLVCDEARKRGFKTLLGSVVPTNKGATLSLRVLLGYGMELSHVADGLIYFKKDIQWAQ